MSRIGNAPVTIESGVEIKIEEGKFTAKGPKGELTQDIDPSVTIKQEDGVLTLERTNESKEARLIQSVNLQHDSRCF